MDFNDDAMVSILQMSYLEQYVNKVIDYTQRYNVSSSMYYAPSNLIGKPQIYPAFGDSPEAYSLVSLNCLDGKFSFKYYLFNRKLMETGGNKENVHKRTTDHKMKILLEQMITLLYSENLF